MSKVVLLSILATASALHHQHPLQDTLHLPVPLTIDGIPLLGFGTWNLKGDNVSEAVSWAIQTGYRHIDCAAAYYNQPAVGRGIRDGLAKAGLRREDIWVTSKLWNDHHGLTQPSEALTMTLQELGIGYLDLWLMHWPVKQGIFGDSIEYLDTWAGMLAAIHGGDLVRHVGVSNFSPEQLETLINNTQIPPQVHQMELHPYLQQNEWVAVHKRLGIHVTAYSPLAGTNPTYNEGDAPPLLENEVVKEIANSRSCTPAQVVLRWGIGRGTSVIPKSIHKNYISENFNSLRCELQDMDIEKLDELGAYRNRFNNPRNAWGLSEIYKDLEDSKGEHQLHS